MERKEFTGSTTSIMSDIFLLAFGFAIVGFIVIVFARQVAPMNNVYSNEVGTTLSWIIGILWAIGLVYLVKSKIQGVPKVVLENDSVKIYKGKKLMHDVNIQTTKFEGSLIRRKGVPIGFSLLMDSGEGKKYVNLDGISVKNFQELMAEIQSASKA